MNELKKAFYNVMYKYDKCFTEHGVMENLTTWERNKDILLSILRQHPNWDEKNYAIVLNFSTIQKIDHSVVDECAFSLNELIEDCMPNTDQRATFQAALHDVTSEYSKIPSDACINRVKENTGMKCCLGLKSSRVIGKLCKHYNVHTHKDYNSLYARFADALNPLQIQQTGILSIHPCDYLEMSNKDNTWRSCHRLNEGSYQAGCLSYLADSVSMIFYTVDNNVTDNFHQHPKRHRQVFCYKDSVLLQSRLYPDHNFDDCEQFRGVVQGAFALCLGLPNLWIHIKSNLSSYYYTVQGSLQYPDYSTYGTITILKGESPHDTLAIGHPPICVGCGQTHCLEGRIKCYDCKDFTVCFSCGETIPIDMALRFDGSYFCPSCLHFCPLCHTFVQTEMHSVRNCDGKQIQICDECYEHISNTCRSCGVHAACTTLSASSFCSKIEAIAA